MSEAIVRATHTQHWGRPDIAGDVLAVAQGPGVAPPREIRLRPELYERIAVSMAPGECAALVERKTLGPPPGVPVVVDPALPVFPGFEIVRARPGGSPRPHATAA